MVDQVLDAIQPAGLQAALDAMQRALHEDETKRYAVELALEKARYEARRAQRQFDATDPGRLVDLVRRAGRQITPIPLTGYPVQPSAATIMQLHIDDVHLWWRLTEGLGEAAFDEAAGVLSRHERSRADRFRFDADRIAYVCAHALVRGALSLYADIPPHRWRFDQDDALGKPRLADLQSQGLTFSLTHTRGLVACAIARSTSVGIDVERLGSVAVSEIARTTLSARELSQLDGLQDAEASIRFHDLWTLKEAYVKAVGCGLRQPLDRFSFGLERPPSITFQPPPGTREDAWQFALFAPEPRYRMALAICRDEATVYRVRASALYAPSRSPLRAIFATSHRCGAAP